MRYLSSLLVIIEQRMDLGRGASGAIEKIGNIILTGAPILLIVYLL
jgi:hypothetical protein